MKIVNYQEFIKLPAKTLYCETEPIIFGDLNILEDVWNDGNDFLYSNLKTFKDDNYDKDFYEIYQDLENGETKRLEYNVTSRDGLFEYDRKFLIYDKQDIQELINHLTTLL